MKIMAVLVSFALAGCTIEADMQQHQRKEAPVMKAADSQRVTIERIGVFEDNIAYEGVRGVYLIRDKETGRELIGVSGLGISEVGSHSQADGKVITSAPDER